MSIKLIVIILGAGLATYFTRFPLLVISGNREIPPRVTKFMSYIAPAVLTSLIVPAIFIKQGHIDISFNNNYIVASVITALSAYCSKNMLLSVITGICTVGILMYIF
ncbi:AzlD domain-containing protein [Cellulosilyticum sp. I15G10I2]|uniref:AzlD domain-containing protein n=1 Tax=Cellulosilyticum sp. I15G10I2 TaxID=1892843 RepID=UPI00085C3894|nr:AzlD domain-containing protein [Cellulosilyticum sp. I15G10I2]